MTDSLWWLLFWVSLVCWWKLNLLSSVTPRYLKLSTISTVWLLMRMGC
uniref:Uncharacterized protein n=1 Tax=Anguilla anguilla TaxID=7936 RepID=A0A0E9SW80_ANGAN